MAVISFLEFSWRQTQHSEVCIIQQIELYGLFFPALVLHMFEAQPNPNVDWTSNAWVQHEKRWEAGSHLVHYPPQSCRWAFWDGRGTLEPQWLSVHVRYKENFPMKRCCHHTTADHESLWRDCKRATQIKCLSHEDVSYLLGTMNSISFDMAVPSLLVA